MEIKIYDYQNIPVTLTKDTWQNKLLDPIFGHPEVIPYKNQIKQTISKPDFVYKSVRDNKSKLFFTKITKNKFSSYFLAVVVKYVKEQGKPVGWVSTVMINRKLPLKAKLLWERKN